MLRRTKPRGRHPDKALSPAFVRSAPLGRHADGNDLYLFVQPTGTRSWVQRLVIRGCRRELGLGAAGLVFLAEAREQALANRKLARAAVSGPMYLQTGAILRLSFRASGCSPTPRSSPDVHAESSRGDSA